MKLLNLGFALAAAVGPALVAAQMVDEPTCYSWSGGHKSAGSFSKCPPPWIIAAKPAPLPPPVQPSPVMMPQSAPMASCPPLPTPHKRPIVKRKPRVQC